MLITAMDAVQPVTDMLARLYKTPFIALFVFGGLFILIGGRAALKRPSAGTINEAAHNLLLILFNVIVSVFLFGNLSFLSNFLFSQLSLPHLTVSFWETVPNAIIFIIVLFALDFQNYWSHRILHTKYFWGIHALHHSDTHMTWTTSYRIHVFESLVMSFVYIMLAGWMFLPTEIVVLVGVIRGWHSKLNHCQLGWTFGRFRKIIASPNFHRWHHSIEPEAYGKNLSDMFPIWDIMFGTHYDPGLCETELGVEDIKEGFLYGQIYPFIYAYVAIKTRLVTMWPTPSRTPSP